MGLLALAAGQARRFGLIPKFIRALPLVSLLCVLAGVIWLTVLPQPGQFRNTYFSENALLPHQAITFFRETEWDIVRGYKGQVREFYNNNLSETERNQEIANMFEQSGMSAAMHDWEASDSSGQNVYAIQHASRGPHNEAIVIVAPWIGSHGTLNEGAVALILALARFFERWNFWHKNLIFVVPSNSDVALRKWVDAYHTSLQYTAGSIEGAIVLNYELESEFFDHVKVCFDGLNGQLPNLDLVNTAIQSVDAEFTAKSILGGADAETYSGRLETLMQHIWQQTTAGVLPGCGSAMFSGWRIDAITLEAMPGDTTYDITTLGRVCESTARSINNLLEHFHQSFFFYLMLGPRYFVSIASYLPAAMLVANSFSIMALYRIASLPGKIRASEAAVAAISASGIIGLSAFLGYAAVSPLVILVVYVALFIVTTPLNTFSINVKRVLNLLSLAILGLELTTLAMMNFSLALVIGVVCAPIAWVRPQDVRTTKNLVANAVLLSLSCPFVVLAALSQYIEMPFSQLLGSLIGSSVDMNVSTWMVVMSIWVPVWVIATLCI